MRYLAVRVDSSMHRPVEGILGALSRLLMTGKRTVLLVEDNPDDELLALRALRKNGIEEGVRVVRDGAEALDFLLGRGEYEGRATEMLPTVVLLDLNLPKIHGLEVLRQLRQNEETRYLPVVILTTSKEEQDMVSGYSFGANSFICKPVDYDQFIQAIEQLGRYWLLLNETPARIVH